MTNLEKCIKELSEIKGIDEKDRKSYYENAVKSRLNECNNNYQIELDKLCLCIEHNIDTMTLSELSKYIKKLNKVISSTYSNFLDLLIYYSKSN